MTTFLLILMALLLIAALERTNRRQPTQPPGLHGALDQDDRDWARTKLELLARGAQAEQGHQGPPKASPRLTRERLEVHHPRPVS